jgi:hypothetical protein
VLCVVVLRGLRRVRVRPPPILRTFAAESQQERHRAIRTLGSSSPAGGSNARSDNQPPKLARGPLLPFKTRCRRVYIYIWYLGTLIARRSDDGARVKNDGGYHRRLGQNWHLCTHGSHSFHAYHILMSRCISIGRSTVGHHRTISLNLSPQLQRRRHGTGKPVFLFLLRRPTRVRFDYLLIAW